MLNSLISFLLNTTFATFRIDQGNFMYEMEQERKNCLKNCRKFLRVIIFSILFICLIYAGYTFTYKFFVEKPTYTSTRIVPQHDAKFPALSICPTPKGYKDEFLKVSTILQVLTIISNILYKIFDWNNNILLKSL